jgi:hypothetical protein
MQGKLYTIMEICRMFDGIYKEHLDGVYVSNNIFHCSFSSHFIFAIVFLNQLFFFAVVLVVRKFTMSLTISFRWLLNGCSLINNSQWKM